MSIRQSQALLWQTVDFQPVFLPACTRLLFPFAGNPFSSLYYMFFVGFSEILRRWKAAGKFLTLMAFARVLSIYFPTVSAWYKKTIGTKLRWNGFELVRGAPWVWLPAFKCMKHCVTGLKSPGGWTVHSSKEMP